MVQIKYAKIENGEVIKYPYSIEDLRIDNPNVYITPFSDLTNDNYVSVNDYSKSLK